MRTLVATAAEQALALIERSGANPYADRALRQLANDKYVPLPAFLRAQVRAWAWVLGGLRRAHTWAVQHRRICDHPTARQRATRSHASCGDCGAVLRVG